MGKDDAALHRAIDEWLAGAVNWIDDIAGYRAAPDHPGHRWDGADLFPSTQYLVAEITSHHPKLDVSPLQQLLAAIGEWQASRSAAQVPSDQKLRALMDAAVVTLTAVRAQRRSELNTLQQMILEELERQEPQTAVELMANLRTSRATLYGKRGKGGLSELKRLRYVQHCKATGGYSRGK